MDDERLHDAEVPEVVATANSSSAAELIASLLENHGIAAHISADDGGAQLPSLDPLRGVKVFVRPSDAAAARAILDAVEPLLEDEAPPGN
jgi:hypothetical protein